MSMVMRNLLTPLSVWDGALWFLIPAGIQWMILRMTRERMQEFRLVILAPVCWILCSIVGAVFALAFLAFLLLALFCLLFQIDFLSTAVLGSIKVAEMLLVNKYVLSAFARLGLCAAGWGLGWAVHEKIHRRGGVENV